MIESSFSGWEMEKPFFFWKAAGHIGYGKSAHTYGKETLVWKKFDVVSADIGKEESGLI
jgi:hypothetical protein